MDHFYKCNIVSDCSLTLNKLYIHWGKADDRNCKLRSSQDGGHEIR